MAPVVQNPEAQTVEGVKLTFIVPNETETGEHLNGLVVQHIDESQFEDAKKERIVLVSIEMENSLTFIFEEENFWE